MIIHSVSFVAAEDHDFFNYNFVLRFISAQHLLCVLIQAQVREWAITEQVWDTNLATVYLISHYSAVILLWCVSKNIQLLFAGEWFPHVKKNMQAWFISHFNCKSLDFYLEELMSFIFFFLYLYYRPDCDWHLQHYTWNEGRAVREKRIWFIFNTVCGIQL